MILNTVHLNELVPVGTQEREIQRLREAPEGSIVFTMSISSNHDVVETLLSRAGICYVELVGDGVVRYKKTGVYLS